MKFEDFLPHVLPSAEGCPDVLALDHIRKAARKFCARTLVWNFECVPIETAAGVADYTVQIPVETELVRMLLCEVDGTSYDIPNGVRGRQLARHGGGYLCTMKGLQDFTLTPTPQADGSRIVTDVAVKPKLDATTWPDDFEEYVTDIAGGAVATLCSLPNKEWQDLVVADREAAAFETRIAAVAREVAKGMGRAHQRARVEWF